MNYGEKLKELRELNSLTQQEVANSINIKRSSYNQFEQQYDIIPIKRLNQLANCFNVSIDYLLGLTNKVSYKNSKEEMVIDISKDRLKTFRKGKKLTQEKLTKLLQSSRHVIVCYEQGKNFIPTPYLYTICKTYKISADYLLGKIDEPKYLK